MSACRRSGDEIGGTLLLVFRSELFVSAIQKALLMLVFKKKKSVSKYVSALRSVKEETQRKTGGHLVTLFWYRMQNPLWTSVNVCDFFFLLIPV